MPADTPLASCLMPTANRRQFVPGAIARFLAQDFADAELVILDDGEDSVAGLIPPHERIRYIRDKKYRTLGAKRNAAAAAARGSILLHWDDDDWYAPDRIRLQVTALQASGAAVCGIDRAFFIDPARSAAYEYVYPQNTGAPWVYGATLCYRRDFWHAHPFPEMQIGEDSAFAAAVPASALHVMPNNDFFTALIHDKNTSPKQVNDRRWRQIDFQSLLTRTGRFWEHAAGGARGAALVAAASGIGDILRATPLIRALHLLGYRVEVLLAPDNPETADLLRGAPEIAALHVVADSTQGHAAALPPEIAGQLYELASFTRWAAPLAPQVKSRKALHFNPAQWLQLGDTACVAELARAAGWQGAMPAPFALHSGRDFALPPGTIGLHPGCKPDWPWKRWHGFAELANRLEKVVLVGSRQDRDGAGSYFAAQNFPAHVQDFCGELSLADSAALISQCSAFIANDSGLMHLAAVLGVPTIGIFGITSPAREAMDLPAMHVLTKSLPCEPACRQAAWGRRDCAQHLACLKTLTPEDVLQRLEQVLPAPALRQPQPKPARPASRGAETPLTLAVHMEGGIGDVILAAPLVEAAYHAFGHCNIDIYSKSPEIVRFVFHDTPFIRATMQAQPRGGASYDLSVNTLHFAGFTLHNPGRLREHDPDLASRLAAASQRFSSYRGLFARRPHMDGFWGRVSTAAGRNVLDNLGFCSGLAVNRHSEILLSPDLAARATLPALLGNATGYITVHDGFDNNMVIAPGGATKCWPLAHWQAFAAAFRAAHPDLKIVQLGAAKSRAIPGVDINLIGRTSLHQAAWLIQGAALHVDTDSGLSHLARAMHTKAVVLFGPTDSQYYGHETHSNLSAGDCTGCWWSTPDWLARCPRDLAQPACMAAITPERVTAAAAAALQSRLPGSAELRAAALYDGALLQEKAADLRAIFSSAGLEPVPITAHAHNPRTGAYLHASKQWEYLFALAALREFPLQDLRILDAGGGRGALAWHLAAQGAQTEVIDRDYLGDHGGDTGVARRYMQCGTPGLRLRHGSIHNLPAADSSFDAVLCISVVEHLREQPLALAELLRVLRPGGLLILTFDFAAEPSRFEDGHRVSIFSPGRLRAFLEPVCGPVPAFDEAATAASAARLAADGVAGVPELMTVGGVVLRKRRNLSASSPFAAWPAVRQTRCRASRYRLRH